MKLKIVKLLLLVFILIPLCDYAQDKRPRQPNILFILADDLGYHDLSCTGSNYYETPNIDRIAREGAVFTEGYSACQVCSPSRASIMTGKSPARHGITDYIGAPYGTDWRKQGRHNQLLPASYDTALRHAYTTLPEAMKAAGYKTFFAGKWHLGGRGSWPEDHGFDINRGGWEKGGPSGGYFSPWENPNLENTVPGENLSMRLAAETVKFLKENNPQETGQPVFAFLSFYAVHGPIQTTRKKWEKYRDKADRSGIAQQGFKMEHFLPMRQVQDNPIYAGLVETMDDAVGVVLRALDEQGLAENTIVVFTSDNGGVSAGDAYSTSNLPLRGGKGYQFEGGIRVPYFMKVPGLTKGGEVYHTPVIGTDFYPTLLDLAGAGLKPQEHEDGLSLLPLLKGNTLSGRPLIWHYPHYGNQGGEPSSIIRQGPWKLIHYYEDGRDELYKLDADPRELTDVAKHHRRKVTELRATLDGYLKRTGARYPQPDPEYDADKERQYLQRVITEKLPQLERQRMEFLSPEFDPGNNWWGSEVTAMNPNVVIILADDLGYGDVGFNGCEDIPTPNIDRIARNGVKFTDAYVTYAVCGPSRAGLITGRYQDRFGFGRNPLLAPNDPDMGLPLSEQTLADLLKPAGYRTMAIGKWHLGSHASLHPNNRGFDDFFGFLSGGHHYFPEQWTLNSEFDARSQYDGYRTKLLRNSDAVDESEYLTDALSREAVRFVKDNASAPFFLYLAYNAPHTPLQATSKYLDRFTHIADEKRRTYAAMVSAMDDGIGQVLDELDALGITDHTMVVFLSDNGGPETANASDNGPLRGGKGSFFDGGLRVPFAIQWPDHIRRGTVCHSPVISLDIAATVVATIDQPHPPKNELDGINLLPVLNNADTASRSRLFFWRNFDKKMLALRSTDFKLVMQDGHAPSLFRIGDDVAEKNNLFTGHASTVDGLHKQWQKWSSELKDPAFLGLLQDKEYSEQRKDRFGQP